MLDYNVPLGKLNRGMGVIDVLSAMHKGRPAHPFPEIQRQRGRLVHRIRKNTIRIHPKCDYHPNTLPTHHTYSSRAYFLVADDMMDNSITRRGQPCWYRQSHIGLIAINDGIILEACIYRLLKKHFGGDPVYVHLMDLFHDTTTQTAHGQLLDTTTAPIGTVDLSRYTLATYMRIVTYKTAFYTFYLPVACGLRLAGVKDEAAYTLAQDICIQMGQYFQIQDDFLDCFGDPAVIGKIGTDIEDNKCSWLVVQALERANAAQRGVIEEAYGKSDEASVERVKAVYRELDLEGVFRAYEQGSHDALVATIESQDLLPQGVFLPLLTKIYKRQK